MSETSTALRAADGLFTVVAILVGLYAVYRWAMYALVWSDQWAFAQALTWTVLALAAFVPVVLIERYTGGA